MDQDEAELPAGQSSAAAPRDARLDSATESSRPVPPLVQGETDLMTEALCRWVSEGGASWRADD